MIITFKQNINMENFVLAAKNNRAGSTIHPKPYTKNAETFMPNGSNIEKHTKKRSNMKKAEIAVLIGMLAAVLFAPPVIRKISTARAGKTVKKLAGEAETLAQTVKNKISEVSELFINNATKIADGRKIIFENDTMKEFASDGSTVIRKSKFKDKTLKRMEEILPDGKINTIYCCGKFTLYNEGLEKIGANDKKISKQILLEDDGTTVYKKGIFETVKDNETFKTIEEELFQNHKNILLLYNKKYDGEKWDKKYLCDNNGKWMLLGKDTDPDAADAANVCFDNETVLGAADAVTEFISKLFSLDI